MTTQLLFDLLLFADQRF